MQCRYKEKTIICGDWMWVEVHPTWRPAGKRRGKFKETSETQQKLNDRASRLRLVTLVHANFTSRDLALHMTFRDGEIPQTQEDYERVIRNFMAKLRRLYRREGVELKYILVRAWSEKGRPHVHMILSGGVDRGEIEALWPHGYANTRQLEFTETGIADLVDYMAGQRDDGKTDEGHVRKKGERRWSGSRNLVKPVERTNLTRYSKAAMEEIADAGNPHGIFRDRYPGFWLAEFPEIRQNPVTHAWEMSCVLYRPDSPNLAVYARRGDRIGRQKTGS